MKSLAVILILLLLAGCVERPAEPEQPVISEGSLGIGEAESGLEEMPLDSGSDGSLTGQQVDLGSIL